MLKSYAQIAFIVIVLTISVNMFSESHSDQKIKSPNVSGQFYDSNPNRLSSDIDAYFSQAEIVPFDKHVEVVIVPHAGYVYSGGVAAYGFKAASAGNYKTVVIVAPSHQFGFRGISVWDEGGFETPLGVVDVDEGFAKKLIASSEAIYSEPRAFAQEHSLEVEIPFLQKTFEDFKIVPIIMGYPSYQEIEKFSISLNEIVGHRDDVLVVISTDLSHYHDDKTARNMDRKAIEAIKEFKVENIFKECATKTMEMCGCYPVISALLYAKHRGLNDLEVLKYANSGDVSRDKNRVVGYTSIVISQGQKEDDSGKDTLNGPSVSGLSLKQKRSLIKLARDTIEMYVKTGRVPQVDKSDPRLQEVEGAFVTIHKHGRLRGCIGNIIGGGPLCDTVREMAVSSATKDPRFPPFSEENA